jgi:hypothetical protein
MGIKMILIYQSHWALRLFGVQKVDFPDGINPKG